MAAVEPEIGDKASWNWNGAQPGGEVSEKKQEGEVAVQSKRGNTIKKAAQPDDPAIALSRPGNDVVKNQSELQVDEKNASNANDKGGDDATEEEEPEKDNEEVADGDPKDKPKPKKAGTKRKAADDAEGKVEKKARGRPKGAVNKEKKEKAVANGEKKARGRPKKEVTGAAATAASPAKEENKPAAKGGPGKKSKATKA